MMSISFVSFHVFFSPLPLPPCCHCSTWSSDPGCGSFRFKRIFTHIQDKGQIKWLTFFVGQWVPPNSCTPTSFMRQTHVRSSDLPWAIVEIFGFYLSRVILYDNLCPSLGASPFAVTARPRIDPNHQENKQLRRVCLRWTVCCSDSDKVNKTFKFWSNLLGSGLNLCYISFHFWCLQIWVCVHFCRFEFYSV